MTVHVALLSGRYHDSVTLMQATAEVTTVAGVSAAIVAMATPLNLDLYARLGFPADRVADADPNDLLVAIAADNEVALAAAQERLEAALAQRRGSSGGGNGGPAPRRTTGTALRDGGSLVVVSVPGQHAFVEAMDAVHAGASVMLFSDNVPVEQEIALKDEAANRGVLVMGPDCGTAIVGGVGLGFANAVRPGRVGIVAASGTGAQQVSSLLDIAGVGVSAVLGVGGRDLSAAVRGRSTLQAMRMLDAHHGTELVVVLSKPPDPAVAAEIEAAAAALDTPSLVAFIGPGKDDLTVVTEKILTALGTTGEAVSAIHREWQAPQERQPRPGYVRGLFGGGTLCDEAMAICVDLLGPIRSNIPLRPEWRLDAGLHADDHVMIDFGDDALTQGRAHPMIDQSLRLERIAEEATDRSCGVLLLDMVLGYGANPDPARELAPAVAGARDVAARDGRDLAVVVSLVGAQADPQGLEQSAAALVAAGASVHLSNAAAARTAAALVERTQS